MVTVNIKVILDGNVIGQGAQNLEDDEIDALRSLLVEACTGKLSYLKLTHEKTEYFINRENLIKSVIQIDVKERK
jgi:hypothetical protein